MGLIRVLVQPPELRAALAACGVLAAICAIVFGHQALAAFAASDAGQAVGAILVVAVYLAPTIVSIVRRHPSRSAITILNITVGWTVVGWTVALIWAVAWGKPILPPAPERRACPHCAEPILPAARVCRYCGSALRAGWAKGAEILTLSRRVG